MELNPTVPALANELAQAVEVILNPLTPQQNRMDAYTACEQFKEVSPLCAQAGLFLASGQYTNNVKHFGLQLMEHTIKFKWNQISQQEKIFIKENSMKLLLIGVGPAEDTSLSHMKDALSRVIVEMIKREWPQQWGTLLNELSDACTKGEAQTELVLLIFLRLVEDVALLQTIESNQRRKDIYAALTTRMNEIFDFFLRLIELHVTSFRSTTAEGNSQKANAHSRVVQVVLLTLAGFVEWVSINHIMIADGKLLHILCILLNDFAFQIDAAECLSQIVNRKGQAKDRKPLLVLFSEDAMNYIFRAANQSVLPGQTVEQYHLFLKKLIQVLTGLATQLCALWGKDESTFQKPQHLCTYFGTLCLLTRHPSLTISHGASLIWNLLLKHEQIGKDPVFLQCIPNIIEVIGPKVVKIPYPSSRPNSSQMTTASFITMEYDGEEEFAIFFARCRTDFLEVFRQSTLIAPLVTFAYCEHWLTMRLSKAHSEKQTTCSTHDPVYLDWEALVAVLDGVLSRILMVTERPSVQVGLRLLEECLKVDSHDPVIISILLSCISSLFVFLSMSSCQITSGNVVAMSGVSLLPRVLEKIFSALVYNNNNSNNMEEAVKNLRRHAAALMVKLGHKYPLLLLPVFDQINANIKSLTRPISQLSKMEEITLQEALLLISNHFCDFERQSAFIAEIINPAHAQWMTLTNVFKSPLDFMAFIGLDQPGVDPSLNDPYKEHRKQLSDALFIVLGVIKRCTWPEDPDRASRGGFVVALTESGNPICRNPATNHVVPLLPHILALLRVLNELFTPEAMQRLSGSFKKVHSMLEHEKKSLMGIPLIFNDSMDPNTKKPATALDKMQIFLTTLFDNCYHFMGSSGPSLGRDLYQLSGIEDALINSAFASLNHVPDFRLRTIIRVFLKPFVYSCPPAFYEKVLLPIFRHLAPFMLDRLTTRWNYIASLYESGELNEEVNDTQEVLEDMLNRTLTREYLDVLKVALVGGSLTIDTNNGGSTDVTMDQDEHSMDGPSHGLTRATQNALTSEVISDLGGKLLKDHVTCSPIVMTILKAISWNDGNSSLKSVFLTGPIIRYLSSEQLLTQQIASTTLISVLQGLQAHGQHDANQSVLITLGVQIYEILRPKFPVLFEIMQQIPNTNIADLQKLDEKIAMGHQTKGNKIDKAKKDLFKKITAQLIGRSMNQLFRQEVQIANLPPMNLPHRNRNIDLIETSQEAGINKLFTNPTKEVL